jgi:hypothetical protein
VEPDGDAAAALGLVAIAAAGCGGSSGGAASPPSTGKTVDVSLTDKGCDPASATIPAGTVTFNVKNAGTAKVTEFELKNKDGIIIGERENVALRTLARVGRGAVVLRWTQLGFGRTSSTRTDHVTERNLMGFKDGTNNLKGDDVDLMRRHVCCDAATRSRTASIRRRASSTRACSSSPSSATRTGSSRRCNASSAARTP